MDDLNVIDRFTQTFSDYIERGFGFLGEDVAFLTTFLITVDVILAGLFWALNREDNVVAQLLKKVLYVGFFALILNNYEVLTAIIFNSFAGLGLKATDTTLTAAQLLRPGFVADTGFRAAYPLLEEARSMLGFTSFFNNAVTILILLFTWVVVLVSFFILAVQVFITIIEFKLTTLAGFVLVPFALWNKTAFLAERVLGNVIASGIKLMVLAVIVGIGSTMFTDIAAGFRAAEITVESAAAMLLASIALVGLGIFGPGIAAGLVSGAPQLGAGAAVGTAAGIAAGTVAGTGLALGAGRLAGGGASRAVHAGAAMTGGATAAYGLARATSGFTGVAGAAAGSAGVVRAGAGAVARGMRAAAGRATEGVRTSYQAGREGAFTATGGKANRQEQDAAPPTSPSWDSAPEWARKLRSEQRLREAGRTTAQTIRDGDRPANAGAPKLGEEE